MEEWKVVPIEGCEDYMVSNMGNVKILPREVKTHIVNRGRDMVVTAHRRGKMIKPSFDGGRPVVRLKTTDGVRKKLSLPLLVLRTFKPDECPGDIDAYTAAYLDGDNTNNKLDNLVWISKAALMSSISTSRIGEEKEYLTKYDYYFIKVNGYTVGCFKGTNEAAELFNSYGFDTSASAIGRSLKSGNTFYWVFDFVPVSQEEYAKYNSVEQPQMDLRLIYNMIIEDRRHIRKVYENKINNIKRPQKEIVYREKPVIKKVIEKVPVEKIVTKEVIKEVPVEKIVIKEVPVEVKNEEVKEEKKVLVNDRPANVKKTKSKAVKTTVPKITKSKLANINFDDEEPSMEDLMAIEEENSKEQFKRELLRRLNR